MVTDRNNLNQLNIIWARCNYSEHKHNAEGHHHQDKIVIV